MSVIVYGAACFFKVFLAIIQSKNVQHSLYVSAFLTSILMSVMDILYIRLAVSNNLFLALVVGAISNSIAVIAALHLFSKLRADLGRPVNTPMAKASSEITE